jgi:hypothetical protein
MTSNDLAEAFDDDEVTVSAPVPFSRRYLRGSSNAGKLLARHMLWNSCSPELRRHVARQRSLVVIIETPGDWLDLIHEAASDLIRSADFIVRQPSGKNKINDLQNAALRIAISTRRSLVVITSEGLRGISESILAAADHHLMIEPPNRSIIAATLRAVFGTQRAPQLPPDLGTISDADALVAAIRPGENAGRAIRRLVALSRNDNSCSPSDLPKGPTLADLGGYGAAHDWGMDLARDIEAFRAGQVEWNSLSSAAILYGPPGTGKTFFAAALARTCKVPLVSTSLGRVFADTPGYLDSIVKGLDRAFAEARAKAPSLLFIDELDAFPDRKTLDGRSRAWWSTVCNHFLKLLDDSRDRVAILAATNLIDRIDEAILRPGRLDQHFEILPPDEAGLEKMFRLHLGRDLEDADVAAIARLAQGATGALVALYVKSARAIARREQRALILEDLIRQIAPDSTESSELERISIHESGHALAAHLLGRKVDHISTISQAGRGGIVLMEGVGNAATLRRLEEQAIIALAGRNAEIMLLGEACSGAHTDLEAATHYIAALHGSFGLGASLLHRAPATATAALLADPEFRRLVEAELQILDARCAELLASHRDALRVIADRLMQNRVLSGDELADLVRPR